MTGRREADIIAMAKVGFDRASCATPQGQGKKVLRMTLAIGGRGGRSAVVALVLASAYLFLALAIIAPANATGDNSLSEANKPAHEGYYYPTITSQEIYVSRSRVMAEAERVLRVGFITAFANGMMESPSPLPFVLFAKGAEAQKMIILAVADGPFDTLYRARAYMAQLTAVARTLPILADYGVEDWFTFYDLVRLLGFDEIVVSDGKNWAHRITLK
tara:strand:- start:149 stop:799 length:651 start_codon:yes stop_codon:yes gene_type:complete